MTRRVAETIPMLRVVDEALALLSDYSRIADHLKPAKDPLPSLLAQCEAITVAAANKPPEPVRTLHHFACTGGTLISKCLAVMPNTVVLSECDPLSTLGLSGRRHLFAPTDIILGMRASLRKFSANAVENVALAAIQTLHAEATRDGRFLVLRDHAHSHFCDGAINSDQRPTLSAMIAKILPVLSAVTVRHPIDSFISLRRNGWVHFAPNSIEEYCQRYLAFLDAHAGTSILRYEDLVADPEPTLERLCHTLALAYRPGAVDLIGLVTMSGDSGRAGDVISIRPRQPVDRALVAEWQASCAYASLCERLGYDPDTT